MSVIKSHLTTKVIYGKSVTTHEYVLVSKKTYTTKGEPLIIVKDVPFCTITLDNLTTERVTIKAMTDVLVISKYLIDDEFEEIKLQKGASIELIFAKKGWYILSSDGLKNS